MKSLVGIALLTALATLLSCESEKTSSGDLDSGLGSGGDAGDTSASGGSSGVAAGGQAGTPSDAGGDALETGSGGTSWDSGADAKRSACADLDEATCMQTDHCAPLYGTNLPTGFKGYAGCQTSQIDDGDALIEVICHPVLTCALDPANLSECWLFEESDCVPDGWSSIFECNAPACANFQDAG